jgi:L-fuconolactonase
MRIDAHQHFWSVARNDYGWLTPAKGAIYRDFLPPDLMPLIEKAGIGGTILVQAAPTVAETRYLLSLAAENPFIKGVVGWVDFESDGVAADLSALKQNPVFVGVRPMIQDIADDGWMLRGDIAPAFAAVIDEDLTFDALTFPRHLKDLATLLARYPDMRSVIDHASKPQIGAGEFSGWAEDMAFLARETSAFCKLSGLVTEAGSLWTADLLKPYVEHLLSTFGPGRLIWGSDWPVCTLAASYEAWLVATDWVLSGTSVSERDAVLGGNAIKAYKLKR